MLVVGDDADRAARGSPAGIRSPRRDAAGARCAQPLPHAVRARSPARAVERHQRVLDVERNRKKWRLRLVSQHALDVEAPFALAVQVEAGSPRGTLVGGTASPGCDPVIVREKDPPFPPRALVLAFKVLPSSRMPVRASNTRTRSPWRRLTHVALSPAATVWRPGEGIDPRTPQNRSSIISSRHVEDHLRTAIRMPFPTRNAAVKLGAFGRRCHPAPL